VIRIVHVVLQLEAGGMERLLVDVARHADRKRFALEFVAIERGGRIAAEIESLGWPVTVLGVRSGVRPLLVGRLMELFRSMRADVVHTHNTKPLLYAAPAARLGGIRGVVHSRHGQRHGATPRQNLLFRGVSRCADRVVCVSHEVAACCQREGVRPEALRVIWNGIDLERFKAARRMPNGPAVYVGRLTPEKDVATLLRAAARVVEEISEFRLVIAGAGACEVELKALARELNLRGSVEFLGDVCDVPRLLSGASMLVLASRTEGLPLSVLEAMASGLPVVATRVGGTPEAVLDGETGILVESGDDTTLAAAILRVWRDAALGERLGLAGRRRAAECFGVRDMVARYEALYEDVLRGAGVAEEARAA
jgi:glycosyltransferase involved in cell wall biosynthesis